MSLEFDNSEIIQNSDFTSRANLESKKKL